MVPRIRLRINNFGSVLCLAWFLSDIHMFLGILTLWDEGLDLFPDYSVWGYLRRHLKIRALFWYLPMTDSKDVEGKNIPNHQNIPVPLNHPNSSKRSQSIRTSLRE